MRFHAMKAMEALELIAKMEMASTLGYGQIPSPTFYEVCSKTFDELATVLCQLGLSRQADKATELGRFMRARNATPELTSIKNLSLLIHHDLDGFVFEAVPQARAEYYESDHLFGDDVHDKFFSTAYDVREAGNCYALGRNTACVFHLMRVLEVGLSALAKRFNVPSERTNWETIIGETEKAIREMDKDPMRPPNWKDEREFYSQCASHFRLMKDAWRNYTAHARGRYDSREALDMLDNVRGFMQKLAARLHE